MLLDNYSLEQYGDALWLYWIKYFRILMYGFNVQFVNILNNLICLFTRMEYGVRAK